jgi:hypothetical protein
MAREQQIKQQEGVEVPRARCSIARLPNKCKLSQAKKNPNPAASATSRIPSSQPAQSKMMRDL